METVVHCSIGTVVETVLYIVVLELLWRLCCTL